MVASRLQARMPGLQGTLRQTPQIKFQGSPFSRCTGSFMKETRRSPSECVRLAAALHLKAGASSSTPKVPLARDSGVPARIKNGRVVFLERKP